METDVFKDYGFTTAMKLEPTRSSDGVTKFMTYSYLLSNVLLHDPKAEYAFSMYGYCSNDCNANLRINLEHANSWISNYQKTTSNINDNTKGKVVWMWGRIEPNQTNGDVYIMFYPNPNQVDVFTTGYQMFTGITIYRGTEIFRPSMENLLHGIYTIPGQSCFGEKRVEFDDIYEI